MRLARSTVYTLALAATFGIGACGGGDDDDGGGDGVIEGDHHTYVVDSVEIPDTTDAAEALGFDLDGDIGGDPEIDNQLGSVLTTLAQVGGSGLNLQGAIDESVAQGDILLLADVQATDLAAASNAGVRIYFGENPNPPACADASDTVCGKHLQGGASFDIMSGSLADGVSGDIVGGRFTGGPGSLNIQISFSGTLINAHLIRAFAEVTGISADGFTSARLGGAITQEDLDGEVMPAVQMTISNIITEDCTGAGSPPVNDSCGCTGTGESLQSIFASEMQDDCQLDLPELKMNGVVQSVLKPDIDTDEDGVKDALSVGVGASAVGAVYTPPSS